MDRLDRVIVGLRYLAAQGGWDEECTLREVLAMRDLVDACVCNVGVQECPVHPGRLWDAYRRMDFEKAWDAKVKAGRQVTT